MPSLFEHPDYKRKRPNWLKWRDLYEGDHEVLSRAEYLWPHQIEKKKTSEAQLLRSLRAQRTRYLNLIEILVSLWGSYFIKKAPKYSDEVVALFGDALDDVDGKGIGFTRFLKEYVLKDYLLYGKTITLVTKEGVEVKSEAEKKALGIRPYLEPIEPLAAPDWQESDSGLTLFRHEFELTPERQSIESEPKTERVCHAYTKTGGSVQVQRYKAEEKNTQVQTGEVRSGSSWEKVGGPQSLALKEIPVAIIDSESWVRDAAEEALRYHNLRSNKDNIEYIQGYQRIFVAGVNFSDKAQLEALTEYTIAGLPEGAIVTQIAPVDTTQYQRSMDESLNNFFKIGLNQFRSLPTDSRQVQGAETLSEEKGNAFALIETSLEAIENYANQIVSHWAAFEGKQIEDGVELDKEISEQDFERFMRVYQAFADKFRQVPEIEKLALQKAVTKLGFEEEDTAAAVKAIEALKIKTPEEEMKEQQEMMRGKLQSVMNRGASRPTTSSAS